MSRHPRPAPDPSEFPPHCRLALGLAAAAAAAAVGLLAAAAAAGLPAGGPVAPLLAAGLAAAGVAVAAGVVAVGRLRRAADHLRRPLAAGPTDDLDARVWSAGRPTDRLGQTVPLPAGGGRRPAADATARARAEAARRASEERLRLVLEALPTALYVVGPDGTVLLEEGRGLAAIGRAAGQGVGRPAAALAGDTPLDPARLRQAAARPPARPPLEVLAGCRGRTFDVSYSPQRDASGRLVGVVALAADVTDQQAQLRLIRRQNRALEAARAELLEQTRRDPLTGLYNRRALDERLAAEVARAARHRTPLAVVLADVDHFKRLNDALGHPAGDRALKAVAAALAAGVREIDTVARYGGEEFCVLLPGTDAAAGRAVAERLRAAVAACPAADRPVTASFGVAAWGPGVTSGIDLLAAADQALYRAKAAGRNRVTVSGHARAAV